MGGKGSPTNIDGEIKIKRAQNSTWERWNKMYNNLLCIFFIFKKNRYKVYIVEQCHSGKYLSHVSLQNNFFFFFEIRTHNVTFGWPRTHSVDQVWFPTHRSQRSSWVCPRNTGTKDACHHAGLQNKI